MSRSNEKDLRGILSNMGFAFELLKVLIHAVIKKDGKVSDLRRIMNEPELADQIADLIVTNPLADDEYRVHVGYDMPRDKDKLEAEFSKNGVSELFYGNYKWQPHSSCVGIDQTPGERIMLVKHFKYFDHKPESEAHIAEMDKLGYRPATHLEAYAFAKANPELQRQFWIVALGSSSMDTGDPCVTMLSSHYVNRYAERGLFSGWFGSAWDSRCRFLFVRK